MKLIIYYLSLLIFLAVLVGYLISQANTMTASPMTMSTMVGISTALVLYTVAMSLIGEGSKEDERGVLHRQIANRIALIVGSAVLSIGILYQLFVSHNLNYLALIALIGINLSKIISLIYLNYKK